MLACDLEEVGEWRLTPRPHLPLCCERHRLSPCMITAYFTCSSPYLSLTSLSTHLLFSPLISCSLPSSPVLSSPLLSSHLLFSPLIYCKFLSSPVLSSSPLISSPFLCIVIHSLLSSPVLSFHFLHFLFPFSSRFLSFPLSGFLTQPVSVIPWRNRNDQNTQKKNL